MLITSYQPLVWRVGSARAPQPSPSALQSRMQLAARFAASAAHNDDLTTLQHDICRIAAEGLEVKFVKLLVHDSDERNFVLKAGVGWPEGIVGNTRLDADVQTAAGFAWQSGQAVISNNLVAEARFRVPVLLSEHKIVRSINVVVPGNVEAAFGVLEAESPEPGSFTGHDVSFLQLLAFSLAGAVGRDAMRQKSDRGTVLRIADHQMSLHELQHRIRNDLQVIFSSVRREQRRTADAEAMTSFARLGRRVLAVADLYHHLLGHGGGATDDLDMGLYLGSLCGKIADAADLSSRGIALNADTEHLMMPIVQAVRLAIAVNELVTDAIEHAFAEGASGAIEVRLVANERGTGSPMVSVSDDGQGFKGLRIGSAGMTFVEELTRQAGGHLERQDGDGTHWNIRLPSRSPA